MPRYGQPESQRGQSNKPIEFMSPRAAVIPQNDPKTTSQPFPPSGYEASWPGKLVDSTSRYNECGFSLSVDP